MAPNILAGGANRILKSRLAPTFTGHTNRHALIGRDDPEYFSLGISLIARALTFSAAIRMPGRNARRWWLRVFRAYGITYPNDALAQNLRPQTDGSART
jgi:hypothetical protein